MYTSQEAENPHPVYNSMIFNTYIWKSELIYPAVIPLGLN